MNIKRIGSRPSARGPSEWFTGTRSLGKTGLEVSARGLGCRGASFGYLATTVAALALVAPTPSQAQSIQVVPTDSRPASVGSEQYFTGTAIISLLFDPHGERGAGGAEVVFAPGARTVWHSHPAGQILVVTSGVGWVQERGGERIEVEPGDVVWTPPGVEHWHGATPTNAMSHIAIQQAVDGRVVEWLEPVSEAEYRR